MPRPEPARKEITTHPVSSPVPTHFRIILGLENAGARIEAAKALQKRDLPVRLGSDRRQGSAVAALEDLLEEFDQLGVYMAVRG